MAKDIQRNITAALGVNRFADARVINDEEVVETRDCYMKKPGVRASRPVTDGLFAVPFPVAITDTIASGFLGDNLNNEALITYTELGVMHVGRVDMDGGGSLTDDKTLGILSSYPATPLFAQIGKYVVLLPGSPSTADRADYWSKIGYLYDTTTSTWADLVFNGSGNTAIQPQGVCEYKGRAVYWNLKSGMEDCILFADRDDPLTIGDNADDATTGRFIRVGSRTLGKIISCVSVQLSSVADPANTGLLILREAGCHLLTGEPNQSTETTEVIGDLEINDMNVATSCVSHNTVARTPYGVLWLGIDDVWSFIAGSLPQRVGTKLRPDIQRQSNDTDGAPSLRWKLHAAYFDGFYRLFLYAEDQAGTITSGHIAPSDSWWLDLRDGMPQGAAEAKWYGPQVYRVPIDETGANGYTGLHCLFSDNRAGKQFKSLSATIAITPLDGARLALLDMTAEGTRDSNGVTSDLNSPGNRIQPRIVTKAYDVDDYSIDKIYTGLEIASTSPDRTMNVGVTVILDDTEDSTTNRAIAEGESVDQQVCYPNENGRVVGKKVQLQIDFQGGYTIDETNNQIGVYWGAADPFYFDLTNGFYPTLFDLLEHICSVLNAGLPDETFSHNVPSAEMAVFDTYDVTITTILNEWAPANHVANEASNELWQLIGFVTPGGFVTAQFSIAADNVSIYQPNCSFELHRATVRVNVIPRPLS